MFKLTGKILPALVFWGIFIYVLFFVDYPKSLTQANALQILLFFIPLYFAITFTLNLVIKNLIICLVVSLGIILFLILKALDSLNFVSGGLAIISVILLVSYFKKGSRNLTSSPSVHKLDPLQRRKR